MSDKVDFVEGSHGLGIVEGPLTALSWLTILPVRGATAFDRITGKRVMVSLPVVGILFGTIGIILAVLGSLLAASPLLTATLIVSAWALFNRFMHLDGLADVADALGSYTPPERARKILSDPHAGLIGMASALLTLLLEIAGVASLYERNLIWLIFFIPVISRACGLIAGYASFSPMRPTGFGAMLIGTVTKSWLVFWCILILAAATAWIAVANFSWYFLVVIGITLILCLANAANTARHCSKRFAGLNGDTNGFIIETAMPLAAVLLALGAGLI